MRIRWIEIEAEGEAVVAALRTFPAMLGQPQQLPAAVETAPALQLPAATPRKAKREVHVKAAKPEDAPGPRSLKDLALDALREGPKTYRQVTSFMKLHGHPEHTDKRSHSILSYARTMGLARCDRHTNLWSLDGPGAKETARA